MAVFQHPPSVDSERGQIREMFRLSPSASLSSSSVNMVDVLEDHHASTSTLHDPSLSADITLNALAQLGAYRFGCKRSFVSLFNGQEKHIIAEATASISLRDKERHANTDGLYIGVASGGHGSEILPRTVELFGSADDTNVIDTQNCTADRTKYVVCDLAEEDDFKDRPYVTHWPHFRFYAEVPFYSPSGSLLGAFSVVDTKPHNAFDEDAVLTLREIADSISHHLENSRIARSHRRTDRLINGLTGFVQSRADIQQHDVQIDNYNFTQQRNQQVQEREFAPIPTASAEQTHEITDQASVSTTLTGDVSPRCSKPDLVLNLEPNLTQYDGFRSLYDRLPMTPLSQKLFHEHVGNDDFTEPSDRESTLVTVTEEPEVSQQLASVFSHASVLLRECMEADGVMFFDATRRNSRNNSSIGSSDCEVNPKAVHSGLSGMHSPRPPSLSSDGWSDASERLCKPLGFSLAHEPVENDIGPAQYGITENLLRDLLMAFPHGEIFTFDKCSRNSDRSVDVRQEIFNRLLDHLPGANSVLFLPLWDWNKSNWLAGTIMWTCHDQTPLRMEDLHYLKAFGDSIISQIAKVDWDSTEKSKSDFISSVSHELRSPLHGILASTELLKSASLEPGQLDMVTMVETCGLTLLDTMNYLLDFTKINNLTASRKKGASSQVSRLSNLVTEFELDTLIEDVTNSLYAGHQLPKNASQFGGRVLPIGYGAKASAADSPAMDDLSVIVRMEDQDLWRIESVSGAWRRIVMNLVGNALKFTKAGVIEVSLSKDEKNADSKPIAHLSVKDTGRGISPDFLEDKLFTPFSQEDILSEGVGLGLSIVEQLVTSLGGHIYVESEVGLGTKVDVYIPVQMAPVTPDSPPVNNETKKTTRVCLVGFDGYPEVNQPSTGTLAAEAKRKLSVQSSLSSAFLAKPGCSVSLSQSFNKASGDIGVIEEAYLKKLALSGPIRSPFKTVMVLGGYGAATNAETLILNAEVIQVSQPLGPHKILEALKNIPSPTVKRARSPILSGTCTPTSSKPAKHPFPNSSLLFGATQSPPVVNESISEFPVPPQEPVDNKPLHVLVVDDNDINLKILATFMRKIGCTYETATNGLMALEKYQQSTQRFDYVLMDLSMPVMDGIVASSKIREYEFEHAVSRTTIMAVTGVASATMQQEAFAAGIDDYLVKPISLHELKRIMNVE